MNSKRIFSIIVPFYQNEQNIPYTIPRLFKLYEKLLSYELEFIFIEDGSTDKTYQMLKDICSGVNFKYKLIKLSRNYGQIAAIQAGLLHSQGDCAGIISADLQDPPELFENMILKWESGYKLVIAEREDRDEGIIQKSISNLYWKLVKHFAIPNYPDGGFDFCIIDRVIINLLNQYQEKNTQIFPLIFSFGYSYTIIPYKREKREHGHSQWTVSKKIKLFIDTFIAFSYMPIRCISFLGISIAFLSLGYGSIIFLNYFINGSQYTGWTTLAVLISILGGMILITLGIIGEYIWRILDQVRKRPIFAIERTISNEKTINY